MATFVPHLAGRTRRAMIGVGVVLSLIGFSFALTEHAQIGACQHETLNEEVEVVMSRRQAPSHSREISAYRGLALAPQDSKVPALIRFDVPDRTSERDRINGCGTVLLT